MDRLARVVVGHLAGAPLEPPSGLEPEPSYTARVIQPSLSARLRELEIHGLLLAGDGAAPVAGVNFLGRRFHPDVSIAFHSQLVLACEVKLLRTGQPQSQVATAVGQAAIYRQAGYPKAVLMLVDLQDQFDDASIIDGAAALDRAGLMACVVRRIRGVTVLPQPATGSLLWKE